jgi:hypothetical protein
MWHSFLYQSTFFHQKLRCTFFICRNFDSPFHFTTATPVAAMKFLPKICTYHSTMDLSHLLAAYALIKKKVYNPALASYFMDTLFIVILSALYWPFLYSVGAKTTFNQHNNETELNLSLIKPTIMDLILHLSSCTCITLINNSKYRRPSL